MSVGWLVSAACLASFWQASALRAQESPERQDLIETVTVDAGATCLERDRLIERVARWRQRSTVDDPIRVQVRGDPLVATRVFFSVVRAGMPPTERVLDNAPTDCDQLHSAVALSVALAIDAILSSDHAPLMPVPVVKLSTPIKQIARPSRGSSGRSMYLELGLLGGATVGVVTDPAAAALPRVQFAPLRWLSFGLAGVLTRADRSTIQGTAGGFSAAVLAVGLDACAGGETADRLSFFMCAGVRGGQFVTIASPEFGGQRYPEPWWAAAVSGQARAWLLPSVAIGISVEGLFALAQRKLVLVGTGVPSRVRDMFPVGLSVSVGPVFRLF